MRATSASTPSTSASTQRATRSDAATGKRDGERAMDGATRWRRATRDEDAGATRDGRATARKRASDDGDGRRGKRAKRGERARAARVGRARRRDEARGRREGRDGDAGTRRGARREDGDATSSAGSTRGSISRRRGGRWIRWRRGTRIEGDGWASPFDEENDAFVGTPERAAALDEEIRSVKPRGFESVGSQSRDSGKVTYGLRPLYGKLLTKKIKELGDARRLDAVFDLLEMSAIPTTPKGRKITMGAVIGACVKCNELDTAYKLLMKLDGVSECGAGAPAYSALMLGYARQGRLTEALGLLEQWEKGRGPKDGKFGVGKRGNIVLRGSWKWSKDDVPKYGKRDDMGNAMAPQTNGDDAHALRRARCVCDEW